MDAIVIADTAGVIRFWSTGAEKIFGYAFEQAVGQTLDLIVPSEHKQAHWKGFHAAIASGAASAEGQAIPFPVRSASGDILTTRGRLTLLRAPHGQVVAAAVVFEQHPDAHNEH